MDNTYKNGRMDKHCMAKTTNDDPSAFRLTGIFSCIVILIPFIVHFLDEYITQFLTTFFPEHATTLLTSAYLQDIVMYGLLTALLFFYLKASLEPLKTYGWTWKSDYLGVAIVIGLLAGVVMYGIDTVTGYDFSAMPAFSLTALIGVFVGAALLPALFEETLFRGVIQSAYQRLTTKTLGPVALAIIIASAFEIAFHLVFPLYFGGFGIALIGQVAYVALFGGIGGYLYSRTGSLVAPITIHLLGNFTEYAMVWLLR
jgi:membrane protease YdiL (CAAX protease family)